ncbi:hypothetical protein [Saccharopolyspora rhizosphaerae]|nr:hypothetical protein [Saccharopolyspora rhizosphaerae]
MATPSDQQVELPNDVVPGQDRIEVEMPVDDHDTLLRPNPPFPGDEAD